MNTKYHQTEGFKFNPAGLIGLDAGTAKGISKFLRARERELNTIETEVITCEGGPFNGQQIELQPNGGLAAPAKSAEFTVGAWRGHYLGSKWVSTLAADAPAPKAMAAPLPRPKINCDLPAKGFDQLRDLLGEMSINPLERETTIKTRDYSNHFKYGKTDDFGDTIEAIERPGSYSIVQTVHSYKTINRKKIPVWITAIENHPSRGNTWAIDDFGYLFETTHRQSEREHMTEKRQFVTYKIGRTSYTIPATVEAVERLAAKILKVKKFCSDKMLSLGGTACPAVKTQPNRHIEPAATMPAAEPQPVAIVIDTPSSPTVKIEQPAKPLEPLINTVIYSLPENYSKDWEMRKTVDFKPTARQIIVINAVEKAIDLGLRSSAEILANVSTSLNIDAETLKIGTKRVEGGNVGMDCYYARDYIDAQRTRAASLKLAIEFKLKPGDLLGTIVTNDSKRTTGIQVISVRENGQFATITGKRGAYTTTGEMNIESIKRAIDRAVDYGSRKQTYNELIAKRAKTEPMEAQMQPQPVAIVADTLPSPAVKIEQPAKPLATTCNPDAIRLRAKATICRAANRPTWAEKLEAQADALERVDQPEPPEPPPGNKAKTDNPPSLAPMRQRPHKTACRRIVKIRHHVSHPARHLGSRILSQKSGHPVRQKLLHRRAERPDPNSYEPPAIKTVTPSGNFYNPNRAQTHATPTI